MRPCTSTRGRAPRALVRGAPAGLRPAEGPADRPPAPRGHPLVVLAVVLAFGPALATPAAGQPGSASAPLVTGVVRARAVPVDMRSAALLMSDQAGGPLSVAVAAFRRGPAGLWVQLEVDGAALLDALGEVDGASRGSTAASAPPARWGSPAAEDVVAHVYAVGPGQEVVASSSLAVAVEPDLEPRLQGSGLRLQIPLALPTAPSRGDASGRRGGPPPELDLRLLVWAGEAFGLRNLPLPPPATGPMLGEPRFVVPGAWGSGDGVTAGWVVARPEHGAGSGRRADPTGGDEADGEGEAWAGLESRPVLPLARRLEVRFDAFGPPLRSAWAVLDAAGQELEIPIEGLRGTAGSAAGSRGASGTLTLPEELGEGLYRLRLESDGAAPSLPLTVALVRPDRPSVPWPRLAELAARGAMADQAGTEQVLLPEEIEARMKSLKRDLVAALLSENPVEETAKQERLALEALGYQASATLNQVQDEILDALVRALPRREGRLPLLGVVLLHMELETLYSEERQFRLARHALDAALESARRFASSSRGAAAEAGATIGLVGFRQLARRQVASAEKLFFEALELAPDEPTLWWGLALAYERSGQLEEAAEAFGKVVAAWPEHRGARLRLAVVHQRLGERAAARPLLEALVGSELEEADEAWIRRLALQQLVRLELGGRRPADALRWTDRGLASFPRDPSLGIGRALALDRMGRLGEAREQLLELGSQESLPSARTLFNKWPDAEREALASRLAEVARSREAELRRHLAEILARLEGTDR